jgi:hypothetical protein
MDKNVEVIEETPREKLEDALLVLSFVPVIIFILPPYQLAKLIARRVFKKSPKEIYNFERKFWGFDKRNRKTK